MSGDYFSEYLVDDFNSLDKELSGTKWFQKQEEMEQQKMMNEEKQQSMPEMENNTPNGEPSSSDPFRPTYDRRNSTESKKDRLERVKEEYKHKPFISVGAWENLRKRRDKRRQVEKRLTEEMPKDGLAANSPGFTQLIEQNEPTIMPIGPSLGSVKGFCKKVESAFLPTLTTAIEKYYKAMKEQSALSQNELKDTLLTEFKKAIEKGEDLYHQGRGLLFLKSMVKDLRDVINFTEQCEQIIKQQPEPNVNALDQISKLLKELSNLDNYVRTTYSV